MADESGEKNGAKWLMIVLIVSAIFAALIIAAYVSNSFKRDSHGSIVTPAVNVESNKQILV